jgi:hypothetical protein
VTPAWEREVSTSELAEALTAPLSELEETRLAELHAWFTRRYPTPLERLRYAARASAASDRFVRRLRPTR